MDTRTHQAVDVSAQLQIIKTKMPETYKAIQERVKGVTEQVAGKTAVLVPAYGNDVYTLVRRGLRGEPNCFWAMEAGHVVGTPFNMTEVQRDIASLMVGFGSAYVCIFPEPAKECTDGTH